MLLPLFRRLARRRLTLPLRRRRVRPEVECLEDRRLFAIDYWIGHAAPDSGGDPGWNNKFNWNIVNGSTINGMPQVIPANGDTIVFGQTSGPAGSANLAYTGAKLGNGLTIGVPAPFTANPAAIFVPPAASPKFNSVDNIPNLSIAALIFQGQGGYKIGATASITITNGGITATGGGPSDTSPNVWLADPNAPTANDIAPNTSSFDVNITLGADKQPNTQTNQESWSVNPANAVVSITGDISDGPNLVSSLLINTGGALGTLALGGVASTYSGTTTVQSGILEVDAKGPPLSSPTPLGKTTSGTVVDNGATLFLNGGTIANEPLELLGDGVAQSAGNLLSTGNPTTMQNIAISTLFSSGTIGALAGRGTWQGGITLAGTGSADNTAGAPFVTATSGLSTSIGVSSVVTNGVLVPDTLTLEAGTTGTNNVVTGSFDLNKVGGGILELQSANSYTGKTTVAQGTLLLENGTVDSLGNRVTSSLGKSKTTFVASGATLALGADAAGPADLTGNPTTGVTTAGNTLYVSGTGVSYVVGNGSSPDSPSGALQGVTSPGKVATSETWSGTVNLTGNTTVGADEDTSNNLSTLTITGQLQDAGSPPPGPGSGDLTKVGPGMLVLPNANTGFLGNTFVDNGIVYIQNPLSLGLPSEGTITVNAGVPNGGDLGSLQVSGDFTTPTASDPTALGPIDKTLILNGNGPALNVVNVAGSPPSNIVWGSSSSTEITIQTTATMKVAAGATLTVTGGMTSGSSTAILNKDGPGTLRLLGPSPGLSGVELEDGLTIFYDPQALGNGPVRVDSGATLQFGAALTVNTLGTLTLQGGTGFNNLGALDDPVAGSSAWNGSVDLLAPANVNVDQAGGTLTFGDGPAGSNIFSSVGGGGGLTKGGPGTLILAGTQTNSNTGTTNVTGGTLILAKDPDILALDGPLVIGDTVGTVADSVQVIADNNGQLPSSQLYNVVTGVPLPTVTVNPDGFFSLNGFLQTIASLLLVGGDVATAAGVLTLGGTGTTLISDVASQPAAGSGVGSKTVTISGQLSLGTTSGGTTRTFSIGQDATLENSAPDVNVTATISQGPGSGVGLIMTGPAAGAGVMQLDAVNTYGGPTTISQGTLEAGVAFALPDTALTINGVKATKLGLFVLNNFNQQVSSLTGNGFGVLNLGTAALTVGDNTSTTYSGLTEGTGTINKIGTGTLAVNGASTNFTGTVNIDAGVMLFNNDYSSATVNVPDPAQGSAGGTLGGNAPSNTNTVGTVNGSNTAAGTVQPGSSTTSPGVISANGNVNFGSATTFSEDIVNSTTFSQLNATNGAVNLNGAQLVINTSAAPPSGSQFTIINATAGVNGRFAGLPVSGDTITVPLGGGASAMFTITYNTNSVVLSATGATPVTLTVTVPNPPHGLSASDPIPYGTPITLSATVSPAAGSPTPMGTIQFLDNGQTIGQPVTLTQGPGNSAVATLPNVLLNATGSPHNNLTAFYSGQTNHYAPSTSAPGTTVYISAVNLTGNTVSSSPTTTVYGSQVTLTATLTGVAVSGAAAPAGPVAFLDNGQTIDTIPPFTAGGPTSGTLPDGGQWTYSSTNNVAKYTLTVNNLPYDNGNAQTITDQFQGDQNYNSGASTNSASETLTTGTVFVGPVTTNPSTGPVVYGQPITITATVTPESHSTLVPAVSGPNGADEVEFFDITTDPSMTTPIGIATTTPIANSSFNAASATIVWNETAKTPPTADTIKAFFIDPNGGYVDRTSTSTNNPQVQAPGPVDAASTTTTIASSAPIVFAGPSNTAAVRFVVVVSANNSGATPTGTVTLTLDGRTVLNNVSLDSNGERFYSTVLGVGNHGLTATYTSNDTTRYLSSGPATFTEMVLPPPPNPFAGQANPALLMWKVVKSRKNGKTVYSLVLINLDPANAFVGTVFLTGFTSSEAKALGLRKGGSSLLAFLPPGGFSVSLPFGSSAPRGSFQTFFAPGVFIV
jgi:autotransporter-associated beta strand protein